MRYSIIPTNPNNSPIPPCPTVATQGGGGGGLHHKAAYEVVAADSLGLMQNDAKAAWISQYNLWQALQADSTLVDSSAMLLEFDSLASHSRFGYLAKIENLLAKGHYGQAQCLMNNSSLQTATGSSFGTTGVVVEDSSAADTIVQTYLAYYGLFKKYMLGTLSNADSVQIDTIAHLCPYIYGGVVFQARTLYTMIYNDVEAWDNDLACGYIIDTTGGSEGDSTGGEGRKAKNSSRPAVNPAHAGQQYSLYPNPNNGNIILQQQIVDENPVEVEVLNSIGQSMFKKQLFFAGSISPIYLQNLSPGLYLIVLRDAAGKSYTLKFIVN